MGGLAVALFYKFAPAPNDDAYLTRWISQYQIYSSLWTELNLKHLALSAHEQIQNLITADAQKPPVHRLRFPQCVIYFYYPLQSVLTRYLYRHRKLEQHSAHLVPVGLDLDTTGVVVKVEKS